MDQAAKLRAMIKQHNQVNSSNTGNARVITVTSGKGGVGKSSLSINLALQFRKQGKRVIILDADFGLANIEVMFGVIPKYTLADLMFKGKELKEIISEGPNGVQFISGGSGIAKLDNLDKEQIKRILYKLNELEEFADIIIVDTGAGISPSVLEFVVASPEVLLVTTPEPTSITDSYALLKALAMHQAYDKNNTKVMLVTNKVENVAESHSIHEKLCSVVDRFLDVKLEYLGAVPQDPFITKAIMKQQPVSLAYPNANASKAYQAMEAKLNGGEQQAVHERKGVAGFFSNIFGRNKK